MSKKQFLTTILLALSLKCISQDSDTVNPQRGLVFESKLSWEEIQANAKRENKYIFVDLFATWCGPCKMMDRDVFSSEIVADSMRGKFIAVKVQTDSTPGDDSYIKSWYAASHDLITKYPISGVPTYLFFNSQGQLIYKSLGYKGLPEFITMIRSAMDPENAKLYLEVELFRQGKRDFSILPRLAVFAKKILGSMLLADSIAESYKIGYLDKLKEEDILKKDVFRFMNEFWNLIHSSDLFFIVCYNEGDKVDVLMNLKGWAISHVEGTITKEELEDKLLKNGKPIIDKPDWDKMLTTVSRKYSKVDAKLLLLNFEIRYFRFYDTHWRQWASAVDQKINGYPPNPNNRLDVFIDLNERAWDAFLLCKDNKVLSMALRWSELSIKLEEPNPDVQLLDTRANLLYKLGKKEEGVAQEERAIAASNAIAKKTGRTKGPYIDLYVATKAKMLKNEPTW